MAARIITTESVQEGGRVATVTVCNAGKLNVLASETTRALTAAIRAAGEREGVRAIVLRGEGERAMIGGADINEMAGLDGASARVFIATLHEACAALRAAPVPTIARMAGYTLGAGLELAAACDLRIAGESARMGMPEVRVGIPSVIEAALLPALIGWGRTRRLLMAADTIDAATALAWGLVEEVAPDSMLDAALARLLGQLLASPARTLLLQKRLIAEWERLCVDGAIAAGIDAFAAAWDGPEPRERMAAFLTRRRG